jgi:pimeloyl-ACP methyl ester carboxylesterase
MPTAPANGIELYYEEAGDPAGPPLLLIMGLASQHVSWPPELIQGFADRGFRVISYDNRDIGLSTHLDERIDVAALLAARSAGEAVDVPYRLPDMADDAAGLLDHLGIEAAHVVGVSMGGMIAQALAIARPERVRTLTSIMSTTGDLDVGAPTADAMQMLLRPPATTVEEYMDGSVAVAHVIGTPGMIDEDRVRQRAALAWERNYDPSGAARQLAGILASDPRSPGLAQLDVPTLVIHGTADPLVNPSGGERTAEVIPDAKLLLIEGMGHDLPVAHCPAITDAVTTHALAHA